MKKEKHDNILILKCIVIDDEPHGIAELVDLLEVIPKVSVVGTFDNVKDALTFLQTGHKVDVVFSDIKMPKTSGIEAARLFKIHVEFLVYISAYRDFALEAIKVKTDGYLVKPLALAEINEQVDKLHETKLLRSAQLQAHDYLLFKGDTKNSYFKVMTKEVLYFEAMANYVRVHTSKDVRVTYMMLKDIEEELKSKNIFVRIAKSIVISLLFFDRIDGHMVYLENDEKFPVGIPYQKEFYKLLTEHYTS